MSKPRVVIYCRVSTSKQEEDGTSLETQLAKCEAYAAMQGWEIVATFRESASGDELFTRKKFMKALALISSGGAEILLGYALDRISRNPHHKGHIYTAIAEVGASLDSVTEEIDDSLEGWLLDGVRSYAAAKERKDILERTMRSKRARAELKGKLIPGRKPPFGLLWGDAEKTHLIADPVTEPLVRRMFTTVANGGSATGVAKQFTKEGIPTPMGLQVPWRQTTVTKMLRNPIYTGKVEAFRNTRTKGKGRKRDGSFGKIDKFAYTPESERVAFPEGTAPKLISDATFEAVQRQLGVNRLQSTRNNRNPEAFLLRAGFATCGYCGGSLIGCWNARKGEETGTPFYECNIANRTAHGCPYSRLSAKVLDTEVEERLMMVLEDEAFVRQFIEPQFQENGSQPAWQR
jgi:site-specific DNA recombinase